MASSLTSSSGNGWAGLKLRGDSVPGVLPRSFFGRETVIVARELLGKLLIVRAHPERTLDHPKAGLTVARIVETEAYSGEDPASHSCRGETPRSAVIFGQPGVAYVYFIYGMYEMLNFVTEPKGAPGAVLIRAVEPLVGLELMRRRRGQPPAFAVQNLTNGPGKLARAMGIKLAHKGDSLMGPSLFVASDGWRPDRVAISPRVGIREGRELMWRFFVPGNKFVSKAPQNAMARLVES